MARFRVDPRDVPDVNAARRLGVSIERFLEILPNLIARGFPAADPDTGNFDLAAIERWCDARHPHLSGALVSMGPRDARTCVSDRIAKMAAGHG